MRYCNRTCGYSTADPFVLLLLRITSSARSSIPKYPPTTKAKRSHQIETMISTIPRGAIRSRLPSTTSCAKLVPTMSCFCNLLFTCGKEILDPLSAAV